MPTEEHVTLPSGGVVPRKYVPRELSAADRAKQVASLEKRRALAKQNKFVTERPMLSSFKLKPSSYVQDVKKKFGTTALPILSEKLSGNNKKKEKSLFEGLTKIFEKGEKAWSTSGSRPNVTPQQWGYGRVAAVLMGSPARHIDRNIVEKYKIPLIKKK